MNTIPDCTLNPTDLTFVESGYAVNRVGPCARVPAGQGIDLYPYLMRTAQQARETNGWVGCWLDGGEYVIDVVDVYHDRDRAHRVATFREQRYVGVIHDNTYEEVRP